MTNAWESTYAQFRYIAAKEGVRKVADAIPAGRDTVYRLLKGQTTMPSLAVRAGIHRLVAKHNQTVEENHDIHIPE